MGIYQRELGSFKEKPIMENRQTNGGCMNCHSFSNYDPGRMSLHLRVKYSGTIITDNNDIYKVNLKDQDMISGGVYTSWHPGGRFIAFSLNKTFQKFHAVKEKVAEVYDEASDIVIYDTEKETIFTDSILYSTIQFETFPSFSPDGRYLYFCTSPAKSMPDSLTNIRYSIFRVSFNPETGELGSVADTLVCAGKTGFSSVFPRISPDGRFMVFTAFDYGQFPIWHNEADLWIMDMENGGELKPINEINSNRTESYHSWSSNGRWLMFSSRRTDGL